MITITIISFLTGALAGACTILSYCLYSNVKEYESNREIDTDLSGQGERIA